MPIPLKYSFDEVNTRREAGLCIFCDERETPDHHLKHKGLRIFVRYLEDASVDGVEEKESVSGMVSASKFQDTNVIQQQELIQDKETIHEEELHQKKNEAVTTSSTSAM